MHMHTCCCTCPRPIDPLVLTSSPRPSHNAVCVADGDTGTIYPNACSWKNCVTWQVRGLYRNTFLIALHCANTCLCKCISAAPHAAGGGVEPTWLTMPAQRLKPTPPAPPNAGVPLL